MIVNASAQGRKGCVFTAVGKLELKPQGQTEAEWLSELVRVFTKGGSATIHVDGREPKTLAFEAEKTE